jgi:hypothetical protein
MTAAHGATTAAGTPRYWDQNASIHKSIMRLGSETPDCGGLLFLGFCIQHNGSNLGNIHGLNWGSQFRRGIRHAQLRAREKTCVNQYTSRPLLRQHVRGWPKGTTTNHRNNLFLPGPCGVPAGVAEGAARATSSIISPRTCSTCLTCPIVQNDMYATTMYIAAPEH